MDVLALKPAFGFVATCRDGCIHVSVGDVVLQLGTAEYWTLMEMLSEAARRLAVADPAQRQGWVED
ncbi:MAG: hypothetical protein GEU82_09490 [Luteitalea sp.]|nr:hypothetical protein [Luteitalea sp.]